MVLLQPTPRPVCFLHIDRSDCGSLLRRSQPRELRLRGLFPPVNAIAGVAAHSLDTILPRLPLVIRTPVPVPKYRFYRHRRAAWGIPVAAWPPIVGLLSLPRRRGTASRCLPARNTVGSPIRLRRQFSFQLKSLLVSFGRVLL